MYVAVKGGEKAIANAHHYLAKSRRGNVAVPELSVRQIREQMRLAVDRVMTEGSLFDADLAALALKQAQGDSIEAIFLLRAYRTTLPRLYSSAPLKTGHMHITRRISAAFKDMPGGQMLGPTFDYTHRLLDFSLMDGSSVEDVSVDEIPTPSAEESLDYAPRVLDFLQGSGLVEGPGEAHEGPVGDITRQSLTLPASRDVRLQNLARADEGFLLAMGYSTQRGFKSSGGHPFAAEIRTGSVEVCVTPEELGFAVSIGDIVVTESELVSLYDGAEHTPPQFTRGYGISFGSGERKAISMALVDRALRCRELGEDIVAPAQDEEFVLYHSDNVEATGFVEHLKLPHHVDFQSELEALQQLQAHWAAHEKDRQEVLADTDHSPESVNHSAAGGQKQVCPAQGDT